MKIEETQKAGESVCKASCQCGIIIAQIKQEANKIIDPMNICTKCACGLMLQFYFPVNK